MSGPKVYSKLGVAQVNFGLNLLADPPLYDRAWINDPREIFKLGTSFFHAYLTDHGSYGYEYKVHICMIQDEYICNVRLSSV